MALGAGIAGFRRGAHLPGWLLAGTFGRPALGFIRPGGLRAGRFLPRRGLLIAARLVRGRLRLSRRRVAAPRLLFGPRLFARLGLAARLPTLAGFFTAGLLGFRAVRLSFRGFGAGLILGLGIRVGLLPCRIVRRTARLRFG